MTIYELRPAEGYEWVVPLPSAEPVHFEPTSLGESWSPITVEAVQEDEGRRLLRSDFPWWGSDALVLDQAAVKALASALNPYGEFLTIRCPGRLLLFFNVLHSVNGLDETRSQFVRFRRHGGILNVERYAFRENEVSGLLIFKVSLLPRGPIFASEELRALVNKHRLRGLDLTVVSES